MERREAIAERCERMRSLFVHGLRDCLLRGRQHAGAGRPRQRRLSVRDLCILLRATGKQERNSQDGAGAEEALPWLELEKPTHGIRYHNPTETRRSFQWGLHPRSAGGPQPSRIAALQRFITTGWSVMIKVVNGSMV
jgi:hypothetical protein